MFSKITLMMYPSTTRLPRQYLIVVAVSIFATELFMMLLLSTMTSLSIWEAILLDSTMLVVFISPTLYLFIFRPMTMEINKRKQVEQSLILSESKNRALLNATSEIALLIEPNGIIIALNEALAVRFGKAQNELIGINIFDLFPPEVSANRKMHKDEVIRSGKSVRFEDTRDGHYLDNNFYPIFDEQGTVIQLAIFSREVTQFKQMEQELRQALEKEKEHSQLKSAFITTASHEFRTPLAIIQTSAETLHRYNDRLDENQRAHRFSKIYRQVEHMTTLINNVLTVGNLDSTIVFNPVVIDLDSLCQTIIQQYQIANTEYSLAYASSGVCSNILVDEDLTHKVITNLISNAIKFSPEGSNVHVDISCDGSEVVLRVTDKGIGISEEDQQFIFEPFYRSNEVSAISGTGLGLTISKRAIELHGGTIMVESEVGVGSTYTVSLPLQTYQ
jgi:PAS domain S-box-containing protein